MKRLFSFFLVISILLSGAVSCSRERTEEPVKADTGDMEVPAEQEANNQRQLFQVSEGSYRPEMVFVEGGAFTMGDESEETNRPHEVELSSFYISKYLVTVEKWKEFLKDVNLAYDWDWEDPAVGKFLNTIPSEQCPIQALSWYYAVVYCNWASCKDGYEPCYHIDRLPEGVKDEISVEWKKDANGYRLPTEAEWEYAARGGTQSEGFLYPGSNIPEEVHREGDASYPVGQLKPNELGIHDMGGNVSEWCWDFYDKEMFLWLPVKNPSVDRPEDIRKPSEYGRNYRVERGAHWWGNAEFIARRGGGPANSIYITGIRLVRNGE